MSSHDVCAPLVVEYRLSDALDHILELLDDKPPTGAAMMNMYSPSKNYASMENSLIMDLMPPRNVSHGKQYTRLE
jgi:hypothetical protein